jgi:hypothetical protein
MSREDQELREARRRLLYDAYAEAACDPVFLEDMRSTTAAFEAAVADGLEEPDGS